MPDLKDPGPFRIRAFDKYGQKVDETHTAEPSFWLFELLTPDPVFNLPLAITVPIPGDWLQTSIPFLFNLAIRDLCFLKQQATFFKARFEHHLQKGSSYDRLMDQWENLDSRSKL